MPSVAQLATRSALGMLGGALQRSKWIKRWRRDTKALRLCLERIAPSRKDAPVAFELPPPETAGDAAQAVAALVQAVSQGELTPLEGAQVMALVRTFRRTLELTEMEERLRELEEVVRGAACGMTQGSGV